MYWIETGRKEYVYGVAVLIQACRTLLISYIRDTTRATSAQAQADTL